MSLLNESGTGQPEGAQGTGNSGSQPPAPNTPSAGSSWRDSLPDDLKTSPALSSFQDVSALAKSYVHAQSLVGKKGVFVPGEKASEEEWSNFYDQLGRPALDKYEVKPPEGVTVNEPTVKWFKENAHKIGILPKQAQKLLEGYIQHEQSLVSERKQVQDNEQKTQLENLKKEWGNGFDKQLGFARMIVKESGPEFAKYLDESGLGNDPAVIKALSKLGAKYLSEDTLKGEASGKMGSTPAELDREIEALRANPAFGDSSHGQNKWVMSQFEDLMRQRFPT